MIYLQEVHAHRVSFLRLFQEDMKIHLRIAIIQAIDRHCSIDMIADSLGMSMDEILTEIEAIVSAGRKLDINYYIDEVVEPDECDEICDYFRSAETPDLKTAMEKLGYDDFDETNIRLVRIKILSEWGN